MFTLTHTCAFGEMSLFNMGMGDLLPVSQDGTSWRLVLINCLGSRDLSRLLKFKRLVVHIIWADASVFVYGGKWYLIIQGIIQLAHDLPSAFLDGSVDSEVDLNYEFKNLNTLCFLANTFMQFDCKKTSPEGK